jgi:hypothetical protein
LSLFLLILTTNGYLITGDKINYSGTSVNNSPGLGVAYTQLLSKGQSINVKYFSTPKDSLLALKYNWFKGTGAISAGYTFRTYENIKINGPFLDISLMF